MDYNELIEELIESSNHRFKDFNNKIIGETKYIMLGVKTPKLKELARKYFSIKDEILNRLSYTYFEEVMIRGFVIMLIKDYNEFLDNVFNHIKFCDTWAHVDQFSPKIIKKHQSDFYPLLRKKAQDSNPWMRRFVLVIFLGYYLNNDYIDDILSIVNSIDNKEYYVKMANAWLLSYVIIFDYKKGIEFLKNTNLDDFTVNKAISKSRESFRLNVDKKNDILAYKRK